LGDAPATSERIAGRRVACISVSGGIGALVADTLSRSGVELEQPSARASARLCEVGAASEAVNPYDLAGRSDHKTVSEILAILAQDGFDSVVVAEGLLPDEIREPISRAVLDQAHHFNLVALYSVAVPDGERKDFADAGVVVSDSLTSLLRSIATSDGPALRTEPIQDVVSQAPPSGSGLVDESRTKAYLSTLGIRVPRGEVIRTSSSEVPLPGIRPVVLKGVSSLLAHKSDLGLVRVGVHSDAEVLSEIQRLRALLQEVDPTADGVLVEEMIVGGIEAMVGCVRDPLFGPVLVVGFGGVLIEVVRDNAIVIAPASRGEVRAALGKTAILGVLEGHRGKIYDVDALLDVAMAVQNACIANPQIESFELNPVFVLEKGNGAIAADAKLELSSSSHERNGR
jgi:acyl-CoA synthetase (NDP forming)